MLFLRPIRWILLLLTFASIGAFGVSALAPYSEHWLPAVMGVFYPHLMLLTCCWVIVWLMIKPKYAILPVLLLFVTFPLSNRIFSLPFGMTSSSSEQTLHVMSYNVRNFDLYNWSNNMESRNKMMELIGREQPDVLCLQEFYTEDRGEFLNLERIRDRYDYPYHYFRKTYTARGKDHWGVATFSKHPIVSRGSVDYGNSKNHVAIYVDVAWHGDTVRFYNTHLQSVHFGTQDHEFMKKFRVDRDATDVQSFTSIIAKLVEGHEKRKGQVWRLRQSMDKSPHPVILCGDFNDTPISFTYQYLSRGLKDPFRVAGTGFGQTFSGPLPLLRIDYILVDPAFQVSDYRILPENYSDHYPVSCRLVR